MKNIKLKYQIGERYELNDGSIVEIKSIHVYISNFTIGYQLYIENISKRRFYYINESDIFSKCIDTIL